MLTDVAATQNAASPRSELRDDVVPLTDAMKHSCAECGLVESHRFTRNLDP